MMRTVGVTERSYKKGLSHGKKEDDDKVGRNGETLRKLERRAVCGTGWDNHRNG